MMRPTTTNQSLYFFPGERLTLAALSLIMLGVAVFIVACEYNWSTQ